MGKPDYPTSKILNELKSDSLLVQEAIDYSISSNEITIDFKLPEYGVFAIDIIRK